VSSYRVSRGEIEHPAEQSAAPDCLQPPLRCGFRQQVSASVRLLRLVADGLGLPGLVLAGPGMDGSASVFGIRLAGQHTRRHVTDTEKEFCHVRCRQQSGHPSAL
jgi:hypothetical protein